MSLPRYPLADKDPPARSLPAVQRARALFFAEGRDPGTWLDGAILRSWQRCRPLSPASAQQPDPLARPLLAERREQAVRLLRCAQPELDFLSGHALGSGCVVILSDADGLILEEIGSADFLPKAERVALTPGAVWSEDNRGTNAIGTALRDRQALMVLGPEHYLAENGAISCAAAPIFTGRGEVAGVLDVSGDASGVTSHALGLVRLAAQQVEHRMLLAEARGELLRFHVRPGLIGTPREALVVIDDGRLVAANRVALELLGRPWPQLLDLSLDSLVGLSWTRLREGPSLITLPDGRQIAAALERTRLHSPASGREQRSSQPTSTEVDAAKEIDVVEPLLRKAVKVYDQQLPIRVTGETGSGKDVFARRLHAQSRRQGAPFVAVNCAALPESLIESELFGYEAGAFTGARRHGMPGRIREAHGGTLFLDEIGDMPLALQTRLLRVLEDRRVTPLGGREAVTVDFGLVCATHRDLDQMVAHGMFRADLKYRIDGYTVALPSLRDRADKAALVDRLFRELATAQRIRLGEDARERLLAYDWPGNVRELSAVLRACVALADAGATVHEHDLPERLRPEAQAHSPLRGVPRAPAPAAALSPSAPPSGQAEAGSLKDIEREAIERVLQACEGNMTEAARRLGIHRSTLYRRLGREGSSEAL